jgi:drug/metabolite transporter (DMT)-like permease
MSGRAGVAPPGALDTAMLALTAVVWGSFFLLIKRSLTGLDSGEVAALRLALTALALLPFLRGGTRLLHRDLLSPVLIVAVIGSGIPILLFAVAQSHITSATAGIINSLAPLFTLLIGWSWFGVAAGGLQWAGVAIGLAGAVGVVAGRAGASFGAANFYACLAVLATVCYGWSANVLRRRLREVSALTLSAVCFLLIALPSVAFLVLHGTLRAALRGGRDPAALGAVLALALGTALAVALYNRLIQRRGVLFASSVTYLMPAVAILWGVLDGETVTGLQIAALVLILAGVAMVSAPPSAKAAPVPDAARR